MNQPNNTQKMPDLQSVITADLFSQTPQVADIKQVLEFMEPHAQPLSESQIRAIAYLNYLGNRPIHKEYREANKGRHPYEPFIKWIIESAQAAAKPSVFLDTIEALIPKPPTIRVESTGRRVK
jgi:hypothetical protein